MFLGRRQLGKTLPAQLQCVNANGTPSVPDNAPWMKVWSGSALVLAAEMPVFDRYVSPGLFRYPLYLGPAYTTGHYLITYSYRVSTFYGLAQDEFEIIPAGHTDGQCLSMYFYRRPHADFVVFGTESGKINQGRNPVVR